MPLHQTRLALVMMLTPGYRALRSANVEPRQSGSRLDHTLPDALPPNNRQQLPRTRRVTGHLLAGVCQPWRLALNAPEKPRLRPARLGSTANGTPDSSREQTAVNGAANRQTTTNTTGPAYVCNIEKLRNR